MYVLVPFAIYDHGVAGVFETREEAEKVAEILWRDSDGHHGWRIDECEVGVVYDPVVRFMYESSKPTTKPPEIEFVPEAKRSRASTIPENQL